MLKHRFISAKADGADTSVVRPSNWNDTHTVTSFAFDAGEVTANISADANNFSPTGWNGEEPNQGSILYLNVSSACSITGLAGGVPGRFALLINTGTATLTLIPRSGSSLAGNQFAFVSNFHLNPGQGVALVYSSVSNQWQPTSSLARQPDGTSMLGDVNASLTPVSNRYQILNTALTANRAVTLPNTGLFDGMEFHITRLDTSSFTVTITDPVAGNNFLFPSTVQGWVHYRYTGSAWLQIAGGSFTA